MFVSYWTGPYQKAAARLKASLDKLGLTSDINEIPDKGWQANVRHKPTYVLEMLRKHADAYAVVWIDADGDVVQKPAAFWEIEEDLAVRFLHWRQKDVDELLSGTMFVRNSEAMLKAMEEWIAELSHAPANLSCPEQRVLQDMLPRLAIKVKRLEEPYCRILRDGGRHGVPTDSVIVHYQFSRETRYGRAPAAHLYNETKVGGSRQALLDTQVTVERAASAKRKARNAMVIEQRKRPERNAAPRIPDALIAARRREKIFALRKQILAKQVEKEAAAKAIRLAAGMRNRREKMDELANTFYKTPRELYVGGVHGHPPSVKDLSFANIRMGDMSRAEELDGCLSGETVILMGNSPTLSELPPDIYKKYPAIGCNRGLRFKGHRPEFLVIADREAYSQERDSGRLCAAAEAGTKLILSDSLFDPSVLLRGPWEDLNRRAQPVPSFPCYLYRIGPRKKKWNYQDIARGAAKLPVNVTTFDACLVSCQNVSGSMLQAAAIMGAKRIVCIGFELRWDTPENSHFFGAGTRVGAYPQDGSIDVIMAALKIARKRITEAGVEIINISPVTDSPFAKVFGSHPINTFIAESADLPVWTRKEETHHEDGPILDASAELNEVSEEAPTTDGDEL